MHFHLYYNLYTWLCDEGSHRGNSISFSTLLSRLQRQQRQRKFSGVFIIISKDIRYAHNLQGKHVKSIKEINDGMVISCSIAWKNLYWCGVAASSLIDGDLFLSLFRFVWDQTGKNYRCSSGQTNGLFLEHKAQCNVTCTCFIPQSRL